MEFHQPNVDSIRSNFTAAAGDDVERLLRCWIHQGCDSCLKTKACSWCPFVSLITAPFLTRRIITNMPLWTWSCVPNDHTIPLLAPAYEKDVCPYSDERWEIRTQPFGCRVSSTTSITAIVSAFTVLVSILWVFGFMALVARLRRLHASRKSRWKQSTADQPQEAGNTERDPLLAQ